MKQFYSHPALALLALFTAPRIADLESRKPVTFFSFNKGSASNVMKAPVLTMFYQQLYRRIPLALT